MKRFCPATKNDFSKQALDCLKFIKHTKFICWYFGYVKSLSICETNSPDLVSTRFSWVLMRLLRSFFVKFEIEQFFHKFLKSPCTWLGCSFSKELMSIFAWGEDSSFRRVQFSPRRSDDLSISEKHLRPDPLLSFTINVHFLHSFVNWTWNSPSSNKKDETGIWNIMLWLCQPYMIMSYSIWVSMHFPAFHTSIFISLKRRVFPDPEKTISFKTIWEMFPIGYLSGFEKPPSGIFERNSNNMKDNRNSNIFVKDNRLFSHRLVGKFSSRGFQNPLIICNISPSISDELSLIFKKTSLNQD